MIMCGLINASPLILHRPQPDNVKTMQLAKVKIGQYYSIHSGSENQEKFEAIEIVETVGYAGRVTKAVKLMGPVNQVTACVRDLTPWEEHLEQIDLKQKEQLHLVELVEELGELVGPVEVSEGEGCWVEVLFSEQAAEMAISLAGGKALTSGQKPSSAKTPAEYTRRSRLLGHRIRRSLGAGQNTFDYPEQGSGHAACLLFVDDDLDQAMSALEGPGDDSYLAELFS